MIGTVELPPGTVVDGWQVIGAMGKGGFGAVHHVEKGGQQCALKLALHRAESGDDGRTHARTLREVLLLLMLDHPNIVKPRAFGYLPDGRVYFVLEYVDGWTLEEWVERTHPTAREIARVFMKIAGAVAYMHKKGVKHRDLKLKNVLIRREDGEPIIIDFGAATYEYAEGLTGAGLPPGTDRFRAPEALGFLRKLGRFGKERYSFQVADEIFSLGVMLYDVLTDPLPTEHKGRTPLNSPIRLIPFGSPHSINPRVPLAMSDMVMNLLALTPKHRPENMEAVRRELAELSEHKGTEYSVPVHLPSEQRAPAREGDGQPGEMAPPKPRGWPKVRALPGMMADVIRRWSRPVALAGIAAVVLAVAAASWLIRGERPPLTLQPPPRVATAPDLPQPIPMQPPVPAPPVSAPTPMRAPDPAPVAPATAQKEGSTVKSKQPDALKQARNARGLSSAPSATDPTFPAWCRAVMLSAAIAAGCTGAQLRPEPFECPPGALEAMEKELGWDTYDWFDLKLDDRGPDFGHHFYRSGPVVGVVTNRVRNDQNQMRKAPPGTRFFGKVYVVPGKTEGGAPGEIIAVYDRVKLPNREEVPVCFVVGGNGTAAPIREFKGDTAKATSVTIGRVVDSWP